MRATWPVLAVLLGLLVLWVGGAARMNSQMVLDAYARDNRTDWHWGEVLRDAMNLDRPLLPTPVQVLAELDRSVLRVAPDSRRSLVFHAWVTLEAALLGFLAGALGGVALAALILHVPALDRALMPWVVASQAVPILALAPMIIGVLGALGFSGLLPKAMISAYLCFLPVTIGMAKGLRAADPLQLELIRTYSASRAQIFWKLRFPAALPYLFANLKVTVSLAIAGAIVGELPTGAQAGLGARLLAGSYYGQTTQIWATLVMAAVVTALAIGLVGLGERLVRQRMGGRW